MGCRMAKSKEQKPPARRDWARLIHQHLEGRPFRAFTIGLSSGMQYPVNQPDYAWVAPGQRIVVAPPGRLAMFYASDVASLEALMPGEQFEEG